MLDLHLFVEIDFRPLLAVVLLIMAFLIILFFVIKDEDDYVAIINGQQVFTGSHKELCAWLSEQKYYEKNFVLFKIDDETKEAIGYIYVLD